MASSPKLQLEVSDYRSNLAKYPSNLAEIAANRIYKPEDYDQDAFHDWAESLRGTLMADVIMDVQKLDQWDRHDRLTENAVENHLLHVFLAENGLLGKYFDFMQSVLWK